MDGHAVDARGVDHEGERTGLGSGLERGEILLAYHLRGEVGRSAVLARPRGAIGEIMLDGSGDIVLADMVRVIALIGFDLLGHHPGVHNRTLAETLVDARPARVAAEVHDGIEHPGAVSGTALISRHLSHVADQRHIEGCTYVDGLGENGSPLRVRSSVVVV